MDLAEWTVLYVKHKDILKRDLREVRREDGRIRFVFESGDVEAYIWDRLREPDGSGKRLISTLQTRENVEFLLSHWDAFCSDGLTVVFANPEKNEKWVIVPSTHHSIADGNVEPGIRAMAEGIPYV